MCNDNIVAFTPTPSVNNIRFRSDVNVDPAEWDDPIPATQCRSYVLDEEIDLCKENRVIDIEMDGVLAKTRPNYCRCYLFKYSTSAIKASDQPSNVPSHEPTAYKSSQPSINPSYSPSSMPSNTYSVRPSNIVSPKPSPSTDVSFPYGVVESCKFDRSECNLRVSV